MQGVPCNRKVPTIVTSQQLVESKLPLLSIFFELNPLDGSCDQKLHLQAQPLQITYDAVSTYLGQLRILLLLNFKFGHPPSGETIGPLLASAGTKFCCLILIFLNSRDLKNYFCPNFVISLKLWQLSCLLTYIYVYLYTCI